jgi:putative DNA methylase
LPAEKLRDWESALHKIDAERRLNGIESLPEMNARQIALRRKIQQYLDAGYGRCWLRDERIAGLVQNAMLHFDDQRYRLLEWVIMPNHIHAILETREGHPLSDVLHSWKSFTAKEANRILRRTGPLWEPEYFDRYLRNSTHYFVAVRYLRPNPVKAKLCSRPEDWKFSSAFEMASDTIKERAGAGRPRSQRT